MCGLNTDISKTTSKLRQLTDKIKPFLPDSAFLTDSVNECPICDDLEDASSIEKCYSGETDDFEACDDEEFCGMTYYYMTGFVYDGEKDEEPRCSIQRDCGKMIKSRAKTKYISRGTDV